MNNTETRKSSTGLAGMTNLNLLAPIKTGMVNCFEPISYRERLHKVLDGLQAARRNVRESELMPPVFGDAVGQFGIIHGFRYCIVPPVPGAPAAEQPPDGIWQLSLNVTFDGGWEPYMRVIYRDIGTLLDLLLCHTVGYRRSDRTDVDTYSHWVRKHEIEGGLFYTDSSATLTDQAYLAKLETLQRDGKASDLDMAQWALPTAAQRNLAAFAKVNNDLIGALALPLRTLKGLHRLSVYFEKDTVNKNNEEAEYFILKRFACAILKGSRAVMAGLDTKVPKPQQWVDVAAGFADELELIQPFIDTKPLATPASAVPHAALQSHMLARHEAVTHGCVVLLRVAHQALALACISSLADACAAPVQGEGIGHLVAFTHAGLQALDVHPQRLAALPQAFVDGMEARCGLLGDVRGNHPDHWPRPLLYGLEKQGHRVDLKTVHVLLQLRLSDKERVESGLHPRLASRIDELRAEHSGLRVLAVQATRGFRNSAAGASSVVGHFGFVDGISQPVINELPPSTDPVAPGDLVSAGELLLGYANDRGDKPPQALDTLLHNGSFLVVRKLRQHVAHLHDSLQKLGADERELALARMMGRPKNGAAPVPLKADSKGPNDFDFTGDHAHSNTCPLHSHIRRANPRDGRAYTPRILRRGMSYGDQNTADLDSERGVVFMAYCASLAEQFETIQRWLAGGNNTGVSSAQADPFLRVPQQGETHTFRYVLGTGASASVQRVQFGDQPLVQLEWGLYSFVPAVAVLKNLRAMQREPAAAGDGADADSASTTPKAETPEEIELEHLRQQLDDPDRAQRLWAGIRDGTAEAAPLGRQRQFIGTCPEVLKVLKDRGAAQYSVQGFGERMALSVGLNHLGQDHSGPGYADGQLVNAAIENISEATAFAAAKDAVRDVLEKLPEMPPMNGKAFTRRSLDLVDFSDKVLAALCGLWVGLPDPADPRNDTFLRAGGRKPGLSEEPPRCPGNFSSASRFIFSPFPRSVVESDGRAQGQSALGQPRKNQTMETMETVETGVRGWLNRHSSRGSLTIDINKRLTTAAGGKAPSNEKLAHILTGVLLGFPPTVQGNFIRTMETWVESEALWLLQQDLLLAAPHAAATYEQAKAALLDKLIATMRKRPVPEVLWRSPMIDGMPKLDDGHRVVLGITSALTDPTAPDELIFGRDDRNAKDATAHGCPGMNMAKGVLLAMLAGLMQAGSLRPTGSPVLLILTPRQVQGQGQANAPVP